MKIRRKIAYILAAACLVGDAMIITLWQPWYLKQSLAREQLVMQGHLVTLGDAVTPYLLQNQLAAIHEILDTTLARQTEWRSLELRDSSGQLIYPLDIVDTRGLAQALHLTYVIELRHARLATLALVVDQSGQIAALKRNIWMTLAFVTLGVALVGLFIGTTLEIVVGRRARALVAGAERIARGDHGHPIADASEDEIGQVARAFDDMSDAIAANEKQLIEARLAAENSNLAKSAFLANMSHEIRTPMNGILGMAQLLLMPGLNARERDDYARTILGSGQSLLALLNDILDLSKVEAGHLDIEPEAVLPGDILRDIEALYAQGAQQKGLSLVSAWSGPGGQHYALDPQRLRQMLGNLVGNAIKFCAQGAIRVEGREVAVHGEHAMLEFTVTDSGPGIARDKQDLLFKPFSQVDSSITRKYGGTGLGLSIVRSLAQLMHGEVGVESAEGLGARFWFRIQATRVAPPEAGTAARGWPGCGTRSARRAPPRSRRPPRHA